jgi:BirA family transcriptional regulator, biotin operon repressor / biotin---[acetyl-CoA-carboxylase] ligase
MENLRKILKNTFVADLEHHVEIGSTNDRAIACAALDRVTLPLLIVADRQTAGRGRGSNRWWTGQGSLAFSLLVGPEQAGAPRSPLISLAAGLAVIDGLAPLLAGHELGIHWPNDCMVDGRKVAGILVESRADGKQVVGIGINVNNSAADAPDDVRARVATVRDVTGREHDGLDILITVLQQLERRLAELAGSPETIAAQTNERCLQRGKRLEVVQGDRHITGRCVGISADGALMLDVDGRPQAIYSGVVTHLNNE